MKAVIVGWVVCAVAFLSTPAAADPARWAETTRRLEALLANPAAPASGIAVVVMQDGQEVFATAVGKAVIDPEDPARERPLTPDTLLRVASISKLTVGLAAVRLAEQGLLDLEADAGTLLGFPLRNPNWPDRPVTVRMLLNHTSSLRDGDIYGLPVQHSIADLVGPGGAFADPAMRWAAPGPAGTTGGDRGPGAYFTYANINTNTLATVIERVTGERFDLAVARLVLRPLGIPGGFDVRRLSESEFAALAPAYRKLKGDVTVPDGTWSARVDDYRGTRPDDLVSIFGVTATQPLSAYRVGSNASVLSPAGGLRSSARGLAPLIGVFLGQPVAGGAPLLRPETLKALRDGAWVYDPATRNGETEAGFFQEYGLALHCTRHVGPDTRPPDATTADWGAAWGDRWLDAPDGPRLCGHFAEAYGLFGAVMAQPEEGWGFVFLVSGTGAERAAASDGFSGMTLWETGIAGAILHGLGRAP